MACIYLPQGSELYPHRGYTDYLAKHGLQQAQAIKVRAIGKDNPTRYYQPSPSMDIVGRYITESVGCALTQLFSRIHPLTLKGFILEGWGFSVAHNCKPLANILQVALEYSANRKALLVPSFVCL